MFKKKLNVLVVGDHGQLGSLLKKTLQEDAAYEGSRFNIIVGLGHNDVDISMPYPLDAWLNRSTMNPPVKFDYVVNCAAATDTTGIECDFDKRNDSYRANVLGPRNIAEACAYHKVKMIHISTDYVFSEMSPIFGSKVYEFPVNTYGLHKLLGEKMVESAFARSPKNFLILRTSWLYGNSESSFPVKFLKNCFAKDEVEVVDDCFGRPTSVQYLVKYIIACMEVGAFGTFDAQAVSAPCSRFFFAEHILKRWNDYARCHSLSGMKNLASVKLKPVKSSSFKTVIHHPLQIPTCHWMTTGKFKEEKILERITMQKQSCSMYDEWFFDLGGAETLKALFES